MARLPTNGFPGKRASKLKVGDRIRINDQLPAYSTLHKETIRVWKKLVQRGRSVRIFKTDEYGAPWYRVRFKRKDGRWEYHELNVMDVDDNWVLVKRRSNGARTRD